MAEVQRVLSTTPSPATTQDLQEASFPSTSPDAAEGHQPPGEHSHWGHLGLLALAGLGATFGFLTGMGLYGEVRFEFLEFVLQALILGSAAYVLFDPAMEFLHDRLGASRSEFPEGRRLVATAIVALGTIFISAFHHSLGETLKKELGDLGGVLAEPLKATNGLALAAIVMGCVGLIAFGVTHFWVVGAKRQPPRSALYGGITSFVAGIAVVLLLVRYLASKQVLQSQFWGILIGLLALLWFFGPGLLGGLAINKLRDNSSPTRGILSYLAVFSAVYVVLLLVSAYIFAAKFPDYKDRVETLIWLPVVALIFQNLGWALGPFFRHKSCDRHLGSVGKIEQKPTSERRGGNLAVFPGSRDGSSTALASVADNQTSAARAQDLLLKPKGDRMWAAVALVLALVTTGFAYRAGSMRRDPEIADNIERDIQQDSGLRKKGLSVHSAGRVVTLTGVVDDEAEHAAAVQRALSVRGVKQLIDQIKVAPPTPPPPTPISHTEIAPLVHTPVLQINPTISIGGSAGSGKVSPASSPKVPTAQKPGATAQAPEAQKHKGFLNLLKKDKNNQGSAANVQKPAEAPKAADAQKHQGLFHFLKKDKNTENKNVIPDKNKLPGIKPPDKSTKNDKKAIPKKPAAH